MIQVHVQTKKGRRRNAKNTNTHGKIVSVGETLQLEQARRSSSEPKLGPNKSIHKWQAASAGAQVCPRVELRLDLPNLQDSLHAEPLCLFSGHRLPAHDQRTIAGQGPLGHVERLREDDAVDGRSDICEFLDRSSSKLLEVPEGRKFKDGRPFFDSRKLAGA
jgi:hypothetical protein